MNDLITNISDIWNRLLGLFASYDFIIDTIDILLVAFVVYKLIKFMRESRALNVLKGIIFILVGYFIINLFDMQASTYMFRLITDNFILVLIILFAPELRHALESVGRSRFSLIRMFGLRNSSAAQTRQRRAIHAISKACNEMSAEKTGALIVIEKDIELKDIVSSGIRVDANVSKELIGSIFFPNSPLHDGAVIVRNGKICAAGCILPLSTSNTISSDLGTRHRASIGVSEQSDAVVVVVSEETGQISVVHKGDIKRDVSSGELLERLLSLFDMNDTQAPKKIKFLKPKEGDSDEN